MEFSFRLSDDAAVFSHGRWSFLGANIFRCFISYAKKSKQFQVFYYTLLLFYKLKSNFSKKNLFGLDRDLELAILPIEFLIQGWKLGKKASIAVYGKHRHKSASCTTAVVARPLQGLCGRDLADEPWVAEQGLGFGPHRKAKSVKLLLTQP